MTRQVTLALCTLLVTCTAAAGAEQLEEGDFEFAFRFSYTSRDFDARRGDFENIEIIGRVGYMLNDHHQIGAGLGYVQFNSSDAVEFGVSYNYNFRAGQDLNPFVGTAVVGFGGELRNAFDLGYGVEAGVKVFPGRHAGMLFGIAYRELEGATGNPDATDTLLFGGLTLKF